MIAFVGFFSFCTKYLACEREETRHNMHDEIGMERCVLCGKEIIGCGHNAILLLMVDAVRNTML